MQLTAAQQEAVVSPSRSAVILAGAGSGKTLVIIERIARLVTVERLPLDRLCCITFTEKAAAELTARLAKRLGPAWTASLPLAQISTFHAMQARILREHAARIGCDPGFAVCDETVAGLLAVRSVRDTLFAALGNGEASVAALVDRFGFGAVVQQLMDLLDARWHVLHHAARAEAPEATAAEAGVVETFRTVLRRVDAHYRAAKARRRELDFADLEIGTLQLFREHPEIRRQYQRQFRAILVDEAQDMNDPQAELIRLLHAPGVNTVTLVGDPKQSIYRFRGANVAAFRALTQELLQAGGTRILLQENFRSQAGICAFVNTVAGTMPEYEPLVSTRRDADGPPVMVLSPAAPETADAASRRAHEARAIAQYLQRRRDEGHPLRTHALLFQARGAMAEYAAALRTAGIAVHVHGGGGFQGRPEVLDLLAALQTIDGLQRGTPAPTALLRLLRSPLVGCSDDDCYRLCFPDLTVTDAKARPLHEAAMADPRIGALLRSWLAEAGQVSVHALLWRILETTGYDRHCLAADPDGSALVNCERLIGMAARLDASLRAFLDHVREIQTRVDRIPDHPAGLARDNAVQLLTVHAAKGLEFDVVILPDLFRRIRAESGPWLFLPTYGMACTVVPADDPFGTAAPTPRWERLQEIEREEHAAEHARLLYVALTRARDALVLPLHDACPRDGGTWHAHLKTVCSETDVPSSRCEVRSSDLAPRTPDPGPRTSDPAPRTPDLGPRTLFTVSELDTFAKCPMLYHLQYHLHLPGLPAGVSRPPSPRRLSGAQIGDIVHAVIRRVTDDPRLDARRVCDGELARRGLTASAHDHAQLHRLLATYRRLAEPHAAATRLAERPFRWIVNGVQVRGVIDCVQSIDRGWEIVDYKTDRIDRAEDCDRLGAEYELQLAVYAMAASRGLKTAIARTALYFLESGTIVRAAVTPERLIAAARTLEGIIDRITAQDFAIPQGHRPPCERCVYHHNGMCWEDRLAGC